MACRSSCASRPVRAGRRAAFPGTNVAGTVEAVGKDVKPLQPDDEEFGFCTGAFGEYVTASEENFLPKPASLTLEQAAAVGASASTALQLLRPGEGCARG